MAMKDLFRQIGGMFSRVSSDATHRPDGGTSHYRPLRKKTPDAEQAGTGNAQGEQGQYAYIHTGFTGMNPPAQNYTDDTSRAFGQNVFSFPSENTQGEQGYTGMGSFGGRTEFSAQRRDNISYMPGFAPNPDRSRVHVEHIMTLTGLKSCYEAIECMKNGETLIITLDAIANESESIRCQDMLAGAAFTLSCSVRLLMGARIVVIAPEGVKILPEQPGAQETIRPPEMMTAKVTAAPDVQVPVRRERRTGTHAAEWNAARESKMTDYNPYTGTIPVAAGAYGHFGGYGY